VIENRAGAGGAMAAATVAKAVPDGYTLLMLSSQFSIGAAIHKNLPYDAVRDFAGVTQIGFSTNVLIVAPSLGVRSVKELMALGQTKQLIFSSAGAGSGTHMNGERFRLAAGIKVTSVGFKGASDATIEVIAGRVHFALVGLAGALPFIQDGKLVAVAVGMPQRTSILPDVPTIAETLPGYARDGSHSLLAPAGTPLAVRQRLSKEVARIFELPDIKERFKNFDFVAGASTPEEHEKIIRADIATFSGVVRLAGLRPDLAGDAKGVIKETAGKGIATSKGGGT
jgi:tripartite-type tricarboxylate transporter receptor subunit TctC